MRLFSFSKNEEQPRRRLGCLGKTIIGIGIYFLVCALVGKAMGDMMSTPATVLEPNTVYRIDLSGVLVEQAMEEMPFNQQPQSQVLLKLTELFVELFHCISHPCFLRRPGMDFHSRPRSVDFGNRISSGQPQRTAGCAARSSPA